MKTLTFLLGLSFACALISCNDKAVNTTSHVTLEVYQRFGNENMGIKSYVVREVIDSLIRNDQDGTPADLRARSYYLQDGKFLWINRHGLTSQADTLLKYLLTVESLGFSPRRFCVPQIRQDIQIVRNLNFEEGRPASWILGRLEYYLTKAYLRYAKGQRFGYVDPTFLLNRLDTLKPNKPDTIHRPVRYRGLYDVKMDLPDNFFYAQALHKIMVDSVPSFLKEIQPVSNFYNSLLQDYESGGGTQNWRVKLLCNMERARWRLDDYPQRHKRYVLVNIPSFHLMAVDESDTLSMRIGCGTFATKTPLLTSTIKRMDVNPIWIVPRSIVEKDMIHYFSRYYCERRGFFVMDRRTGKEVDMNLVHRGMLLDPNYAVVQRGGKGNSLGRLIFRFDNNFSVYLHDTPSRDFFSRQDRGVSHGCVRVEKPFELAKFMLKDKSEDFLENLNYCMTADSLNDKKRIIHSVKIEPEVPVYLAYYTIFPMKGNLREGWEEYPDVYGYNKAIYQYLIQNYR